MKGTMGQVTPALDDRHGRLTPALRDFLTTFVPPGSRCLSVGHEHGRVLAPWMLERGCEHVSVELPGRSALPHADGSFDAALLIGVLDHLLAPRPVAAELHRVLRPGGVLLATAPNLSYWRRRLGRAVGGPDRRVRSFSPGALQDILRQAGFSLVGTEGQDGSIVRDRPLVGHLWKGRASAPYRVAERLLPALLGSRIGAFAIRT
jgi:SAM-dependent methyltransferase